MPMNAIHQAINDAIQQERNVKSAGRQRAAELIGIERLLVDAVDRLAAEPPRNPETAIVVSDAERLRISPYSELVLREVRMSLSDNGGPKIVVRITPHVFSEEEATQVEVPFEYVLMVETGKGSSKERGRFYFGQGVWMLHPTGGKPVAVTAEAIANEIAKGPRD